MTLRIVGDNTSVTAVYYAVVANCSAANSASATQAFTPSDDGDWPRPEQVIQWYRASSFALALDGYNNSASLPAFMPASNTSAPQILADAPLPLSLNMTFLACVNATVGASVPLIDHEPAALAAWHIALIVLGGVAGVLITVLYLIVQGCECCCEWAGCMLDLQEDGVCSDCCRCSLGVRDWWKRKWVAWRGGRRISALQDEDETVKLAAKDMQLEPHPDMTYA